MAVTVTSSTLTADGRYALTLTDGTTTWTQVLSAPMTPTLPLAATSVGSPSVATSFGAATKAAAKGASGNVVSVAATNVNAAVRYLQLHNKATAPAGTEVPIISVPIPAGSATVPGSLVLDQGFFGPSGLNFATGIGWAISTTAGTFTDAATAAEHTVNLLYV